jgi:predicted DCC family thiol-disulfide oxidoreductase YuxK
VKSIIFFDQHCPLCCRTINFFGRQDKQKQFLFAPLDGKTAEDLLYRREPHLRDLNTVIVLEQPQGKIWIRGKGVFRTLWLLGGKWKWIGWLYKMPLIDSMYQIVANRRERCGVLPPLTVDLLP